MNRVLKFKKNIKFTEKIFTEKHLKKIHPKYIAAVELHRSLINQIYGTKLQVNEILKSGKYKILIFVFFKVSHVATRYFKLAIQ